MCLPKRTAGHELGVIFFIPVGYNEQVRSWFSMKKYRVGIVGATGMVGQRFISLLKDLSRGGG